LEQISPLALQAAREESRSQNGPSGSEEGSHSILVVALYLEIDETPTGNRQVLAMRG
jgi:hypothetical protein